MKWITLLAVLAMVLDSIFGTQSSVGGPLTMLLIVFLTMLAVGVHEAWSKRRGVIGWIMSIIAALAGGFLAVILGGMMMEMILDNLRLGVALASSQHPLRYILPAGMALLTLLGSWIALQIVNRLR